MRRIFIIIIFFLAVATFSVHDGIGQTLKIVPPTPNAMKMTEYYAQRPNMYTGIANVTIPLYTIDFDGWQLPLTLSYHATGIRTNEEASEVGLGWALNATGVISRTIRGGDDLFIAGSSGLGMGYVYNTRPVTFDVGYSRYTHSYPPDDSYYFYLSQSQPDTEPDVFNYNFFGYSGSFVLTQKVSDPNQLIHVVKLTEDATSISFDKSNKFFSIITPEGYKGEFTVKERSTSLSGTREANDKTISCGENFIDVTYLVNQSGRFRVITSWYLSKITSPNGQEIIFTYDLNSDGSSPYLSNGRTFGEDGDQPSLPLCMQNIHEHVYLKYIDSEDVRVDVAMEVREDLRKNDLFTPASATQLFPYSQNLKRYKEITITGKDPSSTLSKSIIFTQRYFNQHYHNINSNNEDELLWLRSRLDRLAIDDQEYRFQYYTGGKGLPNKQTRAIDHFGFYNGNDDNKFLLHPTFEAAYPNYCSLSDNAIYYYRNNHDRITNFSFGQAGLLKLVKYPTKGYSVFEYEPHSYMPEENGNLILETSGLKMAGGARIKSIKEFDINDNLVRHRYYRYTKNGQVNLLATTGRLMTPLLNLGKIPHFQLGVIDDTDGSGQKTDKLFVSIQGGDSLDSCMHRLMFWVKRKNKLVVNAKQLRASVIVKWLKMYNLRKVQYLAGHRYISSTEAYQQSEMQGLTEEVNKFHPLG